MKINAQTTELLDDFRTNWQPVVTAPFGRDIELAFIDADEIHALVFPCRRVHGGWVKADTNLPVNVHPSHWREWDDSTTPLSSRSPS
jgi:hypothetical protein